MIFFAGRLKCSRMMHVEIVPNERSEALIRALIACLVVFGGSPKEWVFDNARIIRRSPWGVEPVVLHPYLRDLVAEYRVIPTFCAPRSGNQKGSVESLVGCAKKSLFFARRFADLADIEVQLGEWLHEVNDVRPCDATPGAALAGAAPGADAARCPPAATTLSAASTSAATASASSSVCPTSATSTTGRT